jgi:hypothetical protein
LRKFCSNCASNKFKTAEAFAVSGIMTETGAGVESLAKGAVGVGVGAGVGVGQEYRQKGQEG